MDQEPFLHEPGSPEAIAAGCTCPPQDGPGAAMTADGRQGYLCDQDCPMHGIEAVKRVLAEADASALPDAANDDEEGQDAPTFH